MGDLRLLGVGANGPVGLGVRKAGAQRRGRAGLGDQLGRWVSRPERLPRRGLQQAPQDGRGSAAPQHPGLAPFSPVLGHGTVTRGLLDVTRV